MFDQAGFAQIRFLEGRWKGTAPDGKDFFEEYLIDRDGALQSNRFADATFGSRTDGSSVRLENGQVISVWGEFSWRATSLTANKACFEPINAPSSFCWEQMDPDNIRVTQRWNDKEGNPQEYSVALVRIANKQ